MKEIRGFFELTGLSLLPMLVLLLALLAPLRDGGGEGVPAPSAAPVLPAEKYAAGAPELPARAPTPEELLPPAPGLDLSILGGSGAAVGTPELSAEEKTVPVSAPVSPDRSLTVSLLLAGEVRSLSLRDYLVGVVAAEMPASFEPEALAAQAVAARTDTLYRRLVAHPHREADCCADPGCCKAYLAPEELRERWGGDYERWSACIAQAVDETDGEVLTWEGEPIFAAFHAASQGRTEDSENVWIAALPYLRSVPTRETASEVPGFQRTAEFSLSEFRDRVLARYPSADLSGSPEGWIASEERSEGDRLISLQIGGVPLSGTELRSLLGLRSAQVRWTLEEGVFRFVTRGYGHGVGLSQYGAEVMAREGASWEEILRHYYTGAELEEMTSLSGLGDIFSA